MAKKPNPELIEPDNPRWTKEMFKESARLGDLPVPLQAKLRAELRGRPKATVTKERITIRLSPEGVGAFRATGDGWQTRIATAWREWLKTHRAAQVIDDFAAAVPTGKAAHFMKERGCCLRAEEGLLRWVRSCVARHGTARHGSSADCG